MMLLTAKETTPHPAGVFPGVCVDVIDLGLQPAEYKGAKRMVRRVRFVFEMQATQADGRPYFLATTLTASLSSGAKLTEFLGSWRGRPVTPGEQIDLEKTLGVSATLVISHKPRAAGGVYASIDAISRPTAKLQPSGTYNPAEARQHLQALQGSANAPQSKPVLPASTVPAPAALAAPVSSVPQATADPDVGF